MEAKINAILRKVDPAGDRTIEQIHDAYQGRHTDDRYVESVQGKSAMGA